MRLVAITAKGEPAEPIGPLPAAAVQAGAAHARLYERVGFVPPWLGYFALADEDCIGACAFVAAPSDGKVEIAYFTFPGHEGHGVASRMARELIDIARWAQPDVIVTARTLPETCASTTILKKLNFVFTGAVDHPEDGLVWEWRLVG